jgi:putative transposase
MITTHYQDLSIRKQCEFLGISRSNVYYKHVPKQDETILANEIHDLWIEKPYYGYRKITAEFQRRGYIINHKKVLRLMQEMQLQALYPKPKTTISNLNHKIYPYLLKDLEITRPNQVWSTDITYIRISDGFIYLVGLMDIYSRFMVSWRFSNTLDKSFCLDMLSGGLAFAKPDILNTDQGSQFTSIAWINYVEEREIKVSMDGRGRWADNIFIERFWRTLKHEHILIHSFETVHEVKHSVDKFIEIYNNERLHQSLNYKTPAEVYHAL